MVPTDRAKGHGHHPEHRKFHLNIMKKFFMLRMTKDWNRIPREFGELLPEPFKTYLDAFLCKLI